MNTIAVIARKRNWENEKLEHTNRNTRIRINGDISDIAVPRG